jgi:hypothetical protein
VKLSYLMIVSAIVTLIYGLGFVLVPETLLSLYGINNMPAAGLLMARLFGGTLLGFAAIYFLARSAEDSQARQGIVTGAFVATFVGFVVTLLAQINNVIPSSLGWLNVILYLLLALGFGYFLMPRAASTAMKPEAS